MAVQIERDPALIRSITLVSKRGGHNDHARLIFAKCVGASTVVFTASAPGWANAANIEVPKSEALAFANYLKEMCST